MKSLRFWKRRQAEGTSRSLRQRNERMRLERAVRPLVEPLESRLLLAADITVIAGAAGSGTLDHFLSAANGTITTANDPGDAGATLSTGALTGVAAGVSISINATTNIAFNDIGSVGLKTGSGATAAFSANNGSITFGNLANTLSTFGGDFNFVAGTALTSANLIASGGNIGLTAGTAGAGNLQFANINTSGAGVLTLQATNASGGAIFQSGAATATAGAINATATGAISVNALSAATVNITSNTASISSTGANPISASGQLNLNGATGITINSSAALISALNSTSGNISITQLASPALALATTGQGIINDASSGSINVINLGGTISVTSGSPIASNNGNVTLAATDFTLNGTVVSGTGRTTLSNSFAGLPVNLGTANVPNSMGITQADLNNITAGGTQIGSPTAGSITVSNTITDGTLQLISNGAVSETSAGMFNVTNLTIDAGGSVTLANNTQTTSLNINATGNVSVNQVESTNAVIESGSGSVGSSGFNPIGASNQLTLQGATGITVITSAASLEATNTASGNINITQVGAPAQALTIFGTGIINDASGGTTSLSNLGSTLTVTNGAPIATFNGSITLLANDFTINGAVNSGTAITTLGNSLFGTPINLGDANVANSIGITQAELNNISAGVVRIGTPTAGAITISHLITEGSLSLITDGSISETSSPDLGALMVTNLRISAAGQVNLNNGNLIDNVASSTNGSAFIEDGNASLNVPAAGVDGVAGVMTNNASIVLYSSVQSVTTLAPISAGNSTAEIVAENSVTVDQVQGTTDTLVAFTGSVSSAGANPIVASTQLDIGAFTGITVNSSTPAINANNSNSGNIFITQLASPALALATINTGVANSAPGGLINIDNLGGSFTVASGTGVSTTSGAITLLATEFTITGTVNSGAGATTLGNSVAGTPINLGAASVPGAIGIAQADLNNITAHVLRVGTATAGAITISAAISDSALSLINGAAITETAGSLGVPNLRVSSSGPVTLSNTNTVANLASSTTGAFLINNGGNPLTIPAAGFDGALGIHTANAPITINMATGALTVNADVNSGGNAVNATVRSLVVANGVTLDIGTGSIRVDYGMGNPSPVGTLAGYLKTGYNNGLWTGTEITSSTAAAHSADAVGYADGSADTGTAAAAGQVLIRYTLNGDGNLDSLDNFNDLVAIVQNFNKGGTDWAHGNFHFGASTTFNDLVAVVQNFNKILAPAAGSAVQLGGTTIPIGQAASTQASTPLAEKPVNNAASNPASAPALSGSDADSTILDGGDSQPLQ